MHKSGFIEDDEIQACATQAIRVMGGTNGKPAAAGEVDDGAGLHVAAAQQLGDLRNEARVRAQGREVVLTRLLAMVETVRDGDPFVPSNAERLQRIAWCVLGLEAMHVAIVSIAKWVSTESTPIDIEWRFNVARWVTVLMLFVLARVFEHGTRMRDDLSGTV